MILATRVMIRFVVGQLQHLAAAVVEGCLATTTMIQMEACSANVFFNFSLFFVKSKGNICIHTH